MDRISLKSQPAVLDPLHPEEPVNDIVAARRWLDERRANGDVRVVIGQLTFQQSPYLVGFTFADQLPFSPFVETPALVDRDLSFGFTYLQGDAVGNVDNVTRDFAMPPDGAAFRSPRDVATWATPLTQTQFAADWMLGYDPDVWRLFTR